MKPFLKWAGGKGQLLEQLDPLFPESFERYHEPFLGGGAVFFHLAWKTGLTGSASLSDANRDLIEVYQVLSDCPEGLIGLLRDYKAAHDAAFYTKIRASKPKSPTERAARFVYLNRTCFNGLYRVNKKGDFNVPMGRYANPLICDEEVLRAASVILKNLVKRGSITHRSFNDALQEPTADDFVYLDPPYVPVSETANFTAYTKDGFGPKDQERLRDALEKLSDRDVKWMLSNADTPKVWDLYGAMGGVNILKVNAKRNINSRSDKRGVVGELVVRNYAE